MFANASPGETAWTVSALFGVIPSVWLLVVTLLTEGRRRRARVDGAVRIDLQKSIAVALGLFMITGSFCLAGVVAMQTPDPPPAAIQPAAAVAAVVIPLFFVVANVAATATAGFCLLQNGALDRESMDAARRDRRATDRGAGASVLEGESL
jgi:hypothetical protein